jgi:hypothetical protein
MRHAIALDSSYRNVIRFEAAWRFAIGGELWAGGDEHSLTLRLCLLFVTVYIGIESARLSRALRLPDDMHITGVVLMRADDDFYLSAQVWQNDNVYRPRVDKKWFINLTELVLGRCVYSRTELSTHEVRIPMPEGGYPATIKLVEDTWTQPRKFWNPRRVVRRADVDIPGGIPHPGKGTASWNLDDDALFGGTFAASTLDEAIAKVRESVMYCRMHYPL